MNGLLLMDAWCFVSADTNVVLVLCCLAETEARVLQLIHHPFVIRWYVLCCAALRLAATIRVLIAERYSVNNIALESFSWIQQLPSLRHHRR